ncbi:universal stress protein [Elongatibacter sediminis]|uniref:Universal stress protein n=1 Tax=Elongatibacter sediminis TaxID=3119006 RepID=A0AAW9RNT3_9GAMM
MDQKLLVGIDCSNCGQRALDYAVAWARTADVPVVVVHVIEWSPYSFNTPMENEARHKRREAELDRAHSEIVDSVVDRLRDQGIDAKGLVRHGHPAHTLNDLANEAGATNIVVGRTGTSRIKSQLFGSVPSTLVQIADVPVTVVP